MTLDISIRRKLTLPAICAPMFLVTTPSLVREACKAGVIGALPRQNARTLEEFEAWLAAIRADLDAYAAEHPDAKIAPLAVNFATQGAPEDLARGLAACEAHGVQIIISVAGDPTELIKHVHGWGGQVLHDVTTLRHAEKAIAAGADGLNCIGAGGGGHSGALNHLTFIRRARAMFDGVLTMAGAISDGAAIRAAEVLGADLAYLGTRFIATEEAGADPAYKAMLVESTSQDLMHTGKITGAPASWLIPSMRRAGLDPEALPEPLGRGMRHDHLPHHAQPWRDLWSAGQGIDLIHDIPSVATLVKRLRREYVEACRTPDMAWAAGLENEVAMGGSDTRRASEAFFSRPDG